MSVFHGAGALVRSQLRMTRNITLAIGVFALLVGGLLRLGSAEPDAVQFVIFCGAVIALVFCPLLAGASLTLPVSAAGVNNAGFARRDALLLLPTGRLALPSAVFAASATMLVAWLAALAGALVVTLGPRAAYAGLVHHVDGSEAALVAACSLGGWLALTSLVAVGPHPAATVALWLAPPAAVLWLMPAMGYGEDNIAQFAVLAGVPLTLLFLVFSFVIYLRPRHLWFTAKKDMTARFDGTTTVAVLLLALLFGIGGLGWVLGGALLATLPLARAWRQAPAAQRGRWSHMRLGHTLGASVVGGTLALAAGLDAAWLARSDDPTRGEVARVSLSPGGRYAALEVTRPVRGGSFDRRIQRIHLIDMQGEHPPRVFPQRFARLASDDFESRDACWSRDGRYLAFADLTLGRIRFGAPAVNGFGNFMHQEAWELLGATLIYGACDVVIYDTETRETQVVEGALFAPGWRTPADLARLSIDLRGRLVVTTGHGAELRLDPSRVDQVVVSSYTDRGPLLVTDAGPELQAGDRLPLGRLAQAVTCLTADGLAVPTPEATGDWRLDAIYRGQLEPGTPGGPLDYVATDGQREHVFPSAEAARPIGQPVDGRLLVRDGQTLRELNLETGAWRELLVADDQARLLELRWDDAGGLFFRHGPRWHWLRPGGELEQLPEWVHEPEGRLADGQLLASDGLQLLVGDDRVPLVSLGR